MHKKSFFTLLISLFLLNACQSKSVYQGLLPAENIQSVSTYSNAKYQVLKQIKSSKYWESMELIKSNDSSIEDEKIHDRGRHRDPEIVNCFGNDKPSSKYFCLHDAGQPDTLKHETPVLLIHGANTVATRSWADPDGDGKRTGLAQYLKSKGYHVFAVTFANKHGDNYIWSKHIGTAVDRIIKQSGAKNVDVLGHSKGGFALRLHSSNIFQGTNPFQKNIRKVIFVGTPHKGIDYSYRHPLINWALYPVSDNPLLYAPMSWSRLLWQGFWQDADMSIDSGYFPGQSQMLARLDKLHPLSKLEQDWYTTYYGGQGFVSNSKGIDRAIQNGGNVVAKMLKSPLDKSLEFANLVGSSPDIPGILNENTGPSDGIVFIKSAQAASELKANGAKLLDEQVMKLNHLELVSHPQAMQWIEKQLAK